MGIRNIFVDCLTENKVKLLKLSYIFIFFLARSVGKTQMNEYSSRSHFVFTLRIFGVNEVHSLVTLQSFFFIIF